MESFNRIPQFPLLPFERDLCDTLGISEQEYRLFAEEVREKGRLRPSEYAHIPDIRCEPTITAVLINLAIGLVLTGVSLLLAPRPEEPEETKQKRLADVRGRSRFNQTSDFSSIQQIAELGDPVPILFGRYQEPFDENSSTGGISVAPTMLWSRLLSYGAHQTFRGIFMLGHRVWDDEGGNRPQLEGILIGNNPLDSISERKFALYWSSGNSDGNNSDRLVSNDLIAGSRAEVSAGDRFTSDDPFLVPTREGAQEGFSMVIQPSNQTEFGVHSPIRNGNSIRVNWDSIPAWFDDIENEKEVKVQRRKIVGENNDGRGDGMAGTGRGYSPKMGLIRHNGFEYDYQTIVDVKVGDTVDFVISEMSYVDKDWATGFGGTAVTADDIQSTTNSMREAADDSLIEGELYQIGESLWQVHSRDGIYITEDEEDSSPSTITLKCIEILSKQETTQIGIAGAKIIGDYVTDEGDLTGSDEDFQEGWVGQLFWPLLKSDFGLVRSERKSEVIDIGIASTVYTQLNGLANFPALPTPRELVGYDDDNIQVSPGTQTLYTKRTSFFTVHIRPSGLRLDGTKYEFVPTNLKFAVTGNRPTEQYNFIRFLCTQSPADTTVQGEFEIRFVGLSMATVARNTLATETVYVLDGKSAEFHQISGISSNGYNFTATYRGKKTPFGKLYPLPEFINKGKKGQFLVKNEVKIGSQLTLGQLYPTWIPSGRLAAYWYEIFGDAGDQNGQTKSYSGRAYREYIHKPAGGWGTAGPDGSIIDEPDDWIDFKVTATSGYVTWHWEKYGTNYAWIDYKWEVRNSSGNWNVNDKVFHAVQIPTTGNPYTFDWPEPLDGSDDWNGGMELQVNEIEVLTDQIGDEEGRIFERYSGVADISFYDEVTLSNEGQAEHRISYVNLINDNPAGHGNYQDLSLLGLVLQSNRQFPSVDQLRVWLPYGVSCYRFLTEDCGPSNLFTDLAFYLLTDKDNGAGAFIGDGNLGNEPNGQACHKPTKADELMINIEGFKDAGLFLGQNRIFFDGAISEPTNVRDYLTQLAPSMLCDFEIANGKFNIRPVVPHVRGTIDPYEIPVKGYFGAGNIIEGSFQVSFLDKNATRDVRVEVLYREMGRNQLPESRSITVNFKDSTPDKNLQLPLVEIDLTGFCTSRKHALMVARYNLSIRRRIKHTITFKTIPTSLGLAPGNLIVVALVSAPYSSYYNGIFEPTTGAVKGINPLPDGTHTLNIYNAGKDTEEKEVEVKDGKAVDKQYWGKLFSKLPEIEERRYYRIDRLEMDEDGLVEVSASFYPTQDKQSRIALDVIDDESKEDLFTVVG